MSKADAERAVVAWIKREAASYAADYARSKRYTSSDSTACRRLSRSAVECPVSWSVWTTNQYFERPGVKDPATGAWIISPHGRILTEHVWYSCEYAATVRRSRAGIRTRGGHWTFCGIVRPAERPPQP